MIATRAAFRLSIGLRRLGAHAAWNPDCHKTSETVIQSEHSVRPGIAYCDEGHRLLDALAGAIHELLQVHQQQFNALIQGDLDCSRFDVLIHQANEVKSAAKYAYLHHLEEHGCQQSE